MHLKRELLMIGVGLALCEAGSPPATAQTNTSLPAPVVLTNRPTAPALDVRPGFRMELVADGSLVESPVALAFDEQGRLFAVEQRDPSSPAEGESLSGRVRLLEDGDNDGIFDTSIVFAAGIERPSGVACSRGGVFVVGTSELSFLLDQDGDSIADLNRTLLRFNIPASDGSIRSLHGAMTWGPDRRIYVTLPALGAAVLNANATRHPPLELRGGGFSFDPLTLQLRAESGDGVTGQAFDDAGHRFVSSSRATLAVEMLSGAEVQRNPYGPVIPTCATLVAARAPSRPLSCLIYGGRQYPTNLQGQAFLADPLAQTVTLLALRPGRLHPNAAVSDGAAQVTLVRGNGTSFRPTHLCVGPDDLLYIADLAREGYPGEGKTRGWGRIWRLVPERGSPPVAKRPDFQSTTNLIAALGDPNAWVRSTAARLLFERRDAGADLNLHRQLSFDKRPIARLEALRALEAGGTATLRDLTQAMGDKDVPLRATATRLAASRAVNGRMPDALMGSLRARSTDSSAEIRLRTALALGSVVMPPPGPLLAEIYARDPAEAWMHRALLTARPETMAPLFISLMREPGVRQSADGRGLLRELALGIGLGSELGAVSDCLALLGDTEMPPDVSLPILNALAEGLAGRGLRLSDAQQDGNWPALANTAQTIAVGSEHEALRADAVRILGACVGPDFVADEYLLLMFAPGLPNAVQIPVIQALANQGLSRDFAALTQRWHLWDPAAQLATLNTLLETERGADALLTAIADGAIPAEALTSVHMNLLRDHPAEMIRARARRVFGAVAPDRSGLLSDVLGALDLQGSIVRGGELFNTRCAYCHQPGKAALGPTPERMHARSALQLLAGIVDPSRETAPDHQTTVLQVSNGRRVWGVAGELNGDVIHLATPEGHRRYRRSAVSFIDRPDWSLMPDNTAAGLTLRDLADLVRYLQGSEASADGN